MPSRLPAPASPASTSTAWPPKNEEAHWGVQRLRGWRIKLTCFVRLFCLFVFGNLQTSPPTTAVTKPKPVLRGTFHVKQVPSAWCSAARAWASVTGEDSDRQS